MGKGGNRNAKKPNVDRQHLVDIFTQQIRKVGYMHVFDFTPYGDGLTRTSACNAAGLVKSLDFITALSHVTPSLALKYGQLKEVLQEVGRTWKQVVEQAPLKKQGTWAGDTADTILILLTHCRRLADKQKFKECCSKATDWQVQQLEKLRELALQGKAEEVSQESTPEKKRATLSVVSTPAKKKKGSRESVVDALDFDIPHTPEVSTPLSEGGQCEAEAELASPVPTSKQRIRDQMGVPKLAKKPSMKGKKKGAKKQPAKTKNVPCKAKEKGKKPELSAEERANLILMPYKSTGACAIRARQGRQILQIKGATQEKSHEMASKLKKKLEDGASLLEVDTLKAKYLGKWRSFGLGKIAPKQGLESPVGGGWGLEQHCREGLESPFLLGIVCKS